MSHLWTKVSDAESVCACGLRRCTSALNEAGRTMQAHYERDLVPFLRDGAAGESARAALPKRPPARRAAT